jgi:tetratricopeptide (TPR) repeat protein
MRSSSTFTGIAALLLLMTGCTRPVANVLLLKAQSENKKGNYKAAIADCDYGILLDATLLGLHYQRAFARYMLKDYDGALQDFEAEIKVAPQDGGGYLGRGLVERQREQNDHALIDFNEAIRLNPKYPAPYGQRGAIKQSKGDFKGAVEDYNRFLALSPNDAFTISVRAYAEYNLGEHGTALADFNRAIQLDPRNALTYVGRGWIKYLDKNLPGAIDDYNKALEINAKVPLAHEDRGIARCEKGDYEGAIADVERVIADDPKSADNYMNRAVVEYCKVGYTGAIADCSRAIDLDPKIVANSRYRSFLLWLAYNEQHDSASGHRLSDQIDPAAVAAQSDWTSKVAAFFLEQINETDFLAAAVSSDRETNRAQHCQAWYYAGMRRLSDGDKITAIDYFEKSANTDKDTVTEFFLSRNELATFARR